MFLHFKRRMNPALAVHLAMLLKGSVYLPLVHGNIILNHKHQSIVGVPDDTYRLWDVLLQDVIKGNIIKQGSKD